MAEIAKIVKTDALEKALEGVRAKVYTRSEVDTKVSDSIAAIQEYELPVASATELGGIKLGQGLQADSEGVVSVSSDYAKSTDVDSKIAAAKSELIGGAPETYDTLKEVADYIEEHKDVETALNAAIGKKADKATTLAGYGITDAKIANGVITLGEASITPLTEHQDLSEYAKTADFDYMTEAEATAMAERIFA